MPRVMALGPRRVDGRCDRQSGLLRVALRHCSAGDACGRSAERWYRRNILMHMEGQGLALVTSFVSSFQRCGARWEGAWTADVRGVA